MMRKMILATVAAAACFGAFAECKAEKGDWYKQAKLGVFVHWGLYAISGQGEWAKFRNGISNEEYAKFAEQWNPEKGCEEAMVRAAAKGGAKYMVFTTRHHDGFSLFDSKINDFNSMRAPAGRDHVRAYAEACRKYGIKVGFYYSLRDWRIEKQDLAAMKRQAWIELEQLMTEYGKVDILWYDGAYKPDGMSRAEYWDSVKLNAAVRRWQPGILINDRAGTEEDFKTIEGRNIPRPPAGAKLWESCLTLQDDDWSFWGYCNYTAFRKTPEQIICQLLHCMELGGNLLINLGPAANGDVEPWQEKLLAKLGDWVSANKDAVYNSHETTVAAQYPLEKGWTGNSCGFFTEAEDRYYLFFHAWPGERTVFPYFTGTVSSIKLDGKDVRFKLDKEAKRLTLEGLPKDPPDKICAVLEVMK